MRPEIVVRRRPATPASLPADQLLLPGSVALDVLDAQQEQAARSLSTGHHVVFGIAGSGKTVLLLARARMLVDRDPTARVLVLCFNKALAAALDAQLDDGPEATHRGPPRRLLVGREDAAAQAGRGDLGGLPRPDGGRDPPRPELWPQSDRYDAVLIDEAHDFEPDWFRCAVAFLRGGAEGELLIVLDGAQSLYQRTRAFTWKGVGVQARGRTRRLDRNYRNTKQILEFAWQVAQSTLADEEETETHVRVLPRKASRQGPVPGYRSCATVAEEQEWVVGQVARFRALGIADRDIAVLYPRNERNRPGDPGRADRLHEALQAAGEVCWLAAEQDLNRLRRSLAGPGVRLSTIHAAKGLEFRAVILAGLDLLPSPWDRDEVRDSRLFYVGLTRAMDHLVVTWAGRSAFTERVQRSNRVVALDGPLSGRPGSPGRSAASSSAE